ncbi:MAG: ParB N-terminal domain-containing protein [Spirochaetales bacterium]
MQMRIEDIKIRKRVRKSLGDLNALMESMRKYGLLQPIVVDSENNLIAGYRRLEAAKQLGWKTISVVVLGRTEEVDRLQMELEENIQRKDFTMDELSDGTLRLEKLKNPGFFYRLWIKFIRWIRNLFSRKKKAPLRG